MARPTVVLDLAGDHSLARDLAAGGVFVPGCTLQLLEDCELVVRAGDAELVLEARVVFADATGAGLELADGSAETRARIAAMATPPEDERAVDDNFSLQDEAQDFGDGDAQAPADETALEDDEHGERKVALNMHERLRGLTLAQQVKRATKGETTERMVLERMYGKNVWEPLLRNPRITGPEVARIARMGALPRPLVELIVSNGAWLQIPEVRRALLSNPRLGTDQTLRVLRQLSKQELKLAPMQTAYPPAVREAARRLLRGDD